MLGLIRGIIYYVRNRKYMCDFRDLTVGGHCGCCGRWIADAIVEKGWEWTVCPNGCKEVKAE